METELICKLGMAQQEIELLKQRNTELISERNKYRSQALMRANKIELLERQLEQAYE